MRNLLIAISGFLAGSGLIVVLVIALTHTMTVTVKQDAPRTASMSPMSSHMASAPMATRKLTIQHLQKGCHAWSDGKMTSAMMRLHLTPGQKLSIMDMDVDAHQMLQFAGPARMRMSGPMMMNHGVMLSFAKKGVYRLGTKTVEMKGGMEVKTIGPDNKLRLLITVA
jgi:hypothetical protein